MPAPAESPFVRLHPDDNVAVARIGVEKGTRFSCDPAPAAGAGLAARDPVQPGHKVALARIAPGEPVRKFGQLIGFAGTEIQPGDWVHSHNLALGERHIDYAFATDVPPDPPPITGRAFLGYRRRDGRAATRNYIGIVSTVNCSATTSKYVAEQLARPSAVRDSLLAGFPHIDGVVALVHKGGCAMQHGGEDHRQLARTLAGFARHPNIAAYLVIGLGCETGQASFLADNYGLTQLDLGGAGAGGHALGAGLPTPPKRPTAGLPARDGRRPPPEGWSVGRVSRSGDRDTAQRPVGDASRGPLIMNIQDAGGVRKTVDRAVGVLKEMLPEVDAARREPIPLSELILATECGGSDGSSGVTANPALGVAADLLVAAAGTAILGETPEIYGAEHLLTRRAVSREVGEKLLERIRWWEEYAAKFGVEIDNNPSVGNKQGGLTTIYEKSLGAIAKGGSTALKAVYRYAEPVTEKGFVVMDTPGYDPASVTGMVAGGANVIVFTTGRGSCFGCKPVPSIKVASNTPMYRRMIDDMDINAGRILDGASVEEVGREIFERIIAVASGEKTKSEKQNIGDEEFCPWSIGPVL